MTMMRWEPFRDMISLRNAMDRLFEDSFVRPSRLWPEMGMGESSLEIDMYQTDNDVVVKAAIPGMKSEEVDISLTGDLLTIKGDYKEEEEVKEKDYFRKERRYGSFHRSIRIPVPVNDSKADAIFEDGILTLTLPKVEEVKPKQIKAKTKPKAESSKKKKK